MAESLGAAVLSVGIDDRQFQAGLRATLNNAQKTGAQISQALQARQSKLAENLNQIARLQKEALSADASRAALLRQQIGYISAENKQQRAGIAALQQKLKLNQQIADETRKQIQGQAASQARQFQSFTGAIAGVATGAAIGGFFKGAIDGAVELETITKKLSNTLGTQGAGDALAFTKLTADNLGLSFKSLSNSYAGFTAAASAANVPLDQQEALFAAIAKAGQSLGLSNEEINGSLLALQQIASKGTVSLEELRGQLGERLPIAFAAAAKGLGVTQIELIKLVESGKLTSTQFFPALTKGLEELTKGANGLPTSAQNFQKFRNAFDEVQTTIGQSLLPSLTDQVKNLTKALEGVGVVLTANKLGLGGGLIGNALGIIPDRGAEAVGALRAVQQQFKLTEEQARALFTDAVKEVNPAVNIANFTPKEFEAVLQRLPALAEKFKSKTSDTTRELLAQKSILGELTVLASQRNAVQSEDVKKIQAANKAITDAQQQTNKAFNLLIKLQDPKLGTTQSQIEQALKLVEATSENVRKIILDASKQAADVLVSAVNRVTEARSAIANLQASPDQGLNQFLTPEQRQLRLNNAIGTRGQDLERAISIGSSILKEQGISFNKSLIDELRGIVRGATGQRSVVGSVNGVPITAVGGPPGSQEGFKRIDDFINAVFQENQARVDLNTATQNLADINSSLSTVNAELATQVQQLAQKDWQVYVTVPGAQVAGDVVGAVTGLR